MVDNPAMEPIIQTKIKTLRKDSRRIRLWAAIYLLGIASVTSLIFWDSHRRFNEQVNRQLLLGAQAVPGILPADYHDRATHSNAISREEFLDRGRGLSHLATANEFRYLYTVVQQEGRIYFTAYSLSDKEWEKIDTHDYYFLPYPDAPPALYQAFTAEVPTVADYTDQWGSYRSVFLPARSPAGHRYVIGADFDAAHLRRNILLRILLSLGIGLLAGLAALPILIDQHRTYRTHTQVLEEWNQNLAQEVEIRTADLSREIAERKAFEMQQDLTIRILQSIHHAENQAIMIREVLTGIRTALGLDKVGLRLSEKGQYPFYQLDRAEWTPERPADLLPPAGDEIGCRLDADGQLPLACLCGAVLEKRTDPTQPLFTRGGSFFTGNLPETLRQIRQNSPSSPLFRDHCLAEGIQTLILVPIANGPEVVGLLHLSDTRPNRMTADVIPFLENLGNTLGLALQRNQLLEDLKAQHKQLEHALADLRKAQNIIVQQERLAALGQLVSGLSHDFNNTLMPIRGLSQFILDNPDMLRNPDEMQRLIQIIATAGRDATDIVQRLKDIFTVPARLNIRPIEVEFLLDDILATARIRWENAAPPIPIEARIAIRNLESFWADEIQIREALLNLIYNSVDAMPSGGNLLLAAETENDQVVLSVSDTGVGMSPSTREQCLEPFFTTKGIRGTGMGLAMVHQIVTRHGGEMDIQSTPGRGTTVHLRLPLNPNLPLPVESPEESPTYSISPKTILVIDDDPTTNEVVRHFLVRDGHDVDCLTDGRQIMDAFRRRRYDLVITDRIMPEFSGEEVIRWVKNHHPDCPVILITGLPLSTALNNGDPSGADLCLEKPITADQLRETIAHLFHVPSDRVTPPPRPRA